MLPTHKVKKTAMPKKNLTNQANNSANPIASQDPATQMIELSEGALSQVWGGGSGTHLNPLEIPYPFYPDPNGNANPHL
jgi:hypothetical protein